MESSVDRVFESELLFRILDYLSFLEILAMS